jgi:hypothetical protein
MLEQPQTNFLLRLLSKFKNGGFISNKVKFLTLPLCLKVVRLLNETTILSGQAVAQLVEALRYKPEDRGFDSGCCHKISLDKS